MIDSAIVGHLGANKRLVIPGLGAFIRKDETGEVVFVEFLKKDDGVLRGVLEREFSLTHNEAIEAIDKYIVTVREAVADKGKYLIAKLGHLYKDANEVFTLAYDPEAKVQEAATATNAPSVSEQKPAPEPVQPIAEEPAAPVVAPTPAPAPAEAKPTAKHITDTAKPADSPAADEKLDVSGLQYQKPAKADIHVQIKKKRADMVMLIAIVAALVAIMAMIYGIMSDERPEINLTPQTETVTGADSTSTR